HNVKEGGRLLGVENRREPTHASAGIDPSIPDPGSEPLRQIGGSLAVLLDPAVLVEFQKVRKLRPMLVIARVLDNGKVERVHQIDGGELLSNLSGRHPVALGDFLLDQPASDEALHLQGLLIRGPPTYGSEVDLI